MNLTIKSLCLWLLCGALTLSKNSTAEERFSASTSSTTAECDSSLKAKKNHGDLQVKMTRTTYSIRDDQGFHVVGQINEQGGLSLDFYLRASRRRRSVHLRGKEEFSKILAHFNGRVNYIEGFWLNGDNLEAFNRLTASGWTLEAAALETWTGREAKAAGYDKPVVKYIAGTPGRYSTVDVYFYRESP